MVKQNKYIVICDTGICKWESNIIYRGESAQKIEAINILKKLYPEAKVYKLTEIRL